MQVASAAYMYSIIIDELLMQVAQPGNEISKIGIVAYDRAALQTKPVGCSQLLRNVP